MIQRPKKNRAPLTLALIALVTLLAGMVIRIRPYDVNTAGAQAIWNQNELYIFLERNKVAWSENIWAFSWSLVKGLLGIPSPPRFHRIDCVVYRVTSNTVDEHVAKGWHVAGTMAPFNGVPHAFIGGGPDTSGVYRWTGKDFVRLSPPEAAAAGSGYTYTVELFEREGWSRADVLPVRGGQDYAITLGGTRLVLRATQTVEETPSSATTTSRIELVKGDDLKSTRVLYDFKDTSGFLSSSEYKNFVE